MFKGPFTARFGAVSITDILDYSPSVDVTTNDYTTIDGRTLTPQAGINASVEVQLRNATVDAIAAVLPQYWVESGDQLSTGQTVENTDGAIDVVAAACAEEDITHDLDLLDCTGQLALRLVRAKASLTNLEIQDSNLLTATITFNGQPAQGEAVLQILGGSDTATNES